MVHGGAGAGKSKLIHDIAQWSEYYLTAADNRQTIQPYIIKLAPTGKAASLIGGLTIHSAFNFAFGNEFTSMSDKKRDNFRNLLEYLEIIIIDEISMVKSDMLYQINLRMQEIKQNTELFGGISVLLFGDIMQLKPVRARWIFESPQHPDFEKFASLQNLWLKFFETILFYNVLA